jgi:DNA-binding transcriptional MerR regulator
MENNVEDLMTPQEVARKLRVSPRTIRNWRSKKRSYGPKFIRLGYNRVAYRRKDVDLFLQEHEL